MIRFTKSYFNIVSRQNNMVLVSITNEENKHTDSKFLNISTGGVAFPRLESMLSTFEECNEKNKLNELSDFIMELNTQKIMIYTTHYFSSTTALLIFAQLCKKLDIYCIVYADKPMPFKGNVLKKIYNATIKEINLIVDEFYEIGDEVMEEDDMNLPWNQYELKFNKLLQECVFEKFSSNVHLAKDESWIEKLWAWADECNIPDLYLHDNGNRYGLSRDKEKLLRQSSLYLDVKSISKLPKEIGNLINLTELYLPALGIVELPKEIGNLVNLRRLSLVVNKLIELPDEIGNLTKLKELFVSQNHLSKISPEIGKLVNLEDFDISYNQLTTLPEEICNLTKLKELSLSHNNLKGIPRSLSSLASLKHLYLHNNQHLLVTQKQKDWIEKNNLCIFAFELNVSE